MLKVGIDFSITSTAVCIDDGEGYEWAVFPSNYKSHIKDFQHHEALKDTIHIFPYTRKFTKGAEYSLKEWEKFENSLMLADHFVESLQGIIGNRDAKFGFEGFSYGSKGSSAFDMIIYATNVKHKLSKEFNTSFCTISPNTVKGNLCDKGNAGKFYILEWIQNNGQDPKLLKDPFFNYIKDLDVSCMKKVQSPIDDLIDSLGCVYSMD